MKEIILKMHKLISNHIMKEMINTILFTKNSKYSIHNEYKKYPSFFNVTFNYFQNIY